jgi:hypothetical protein
MIMMKILGKMNSMIMKKTLLLLKMMNFQMKNSVEVKKKIKRQLEINLRVDLNHNLKKEILDLIKIKLKIF